MDEDAGSQGTTIRLALPADADAIARIFLESAEYHAGLDAERYVVPAIEPISAHYRERAGGITLVAESGGEITGFIDAQLERSPDLMHRELTYCHVAEIAVGHRYQKRGIGARLLEAAEDWGRGQGAEFASLEYHAANTGAGRFYRQRMGYRDAAITAIKRL